MPTSDDLMGYGMGPFQATELGNAVQTVTCIGTANTTTATITTEPHTVILKAAAGATGVLLPVNAKIGTPYYIFNTGSARGIVFPPGTGTINTVAAATGLTMSANTSGGLFLRTGGTAAAPTWVTFPLAP